MSKDASLAEFLSVTRADVTLATEILNGVNWDLQKAYAFFYGEDPKPANTGIKATVYGAPPVNTSNNPVQAERFALAGSNQKFTETRELAKKRNRWIIVSLTDDTPPSSPFMNYWVRDLMNCRFVGLELIRVEQNGSWFYHNYKVSAVPFFAIIDPVTAECLEKYSGNLFGKALNEWMRQFLFTHPERGLPIDVELDMIKSQTYNSDVEVEDTDSEQTKAKAEQMSDAEAQQEDLGQTVNVMVQLKDRKRSKIEIGENQTLKHLYKKVSEIMGVSSDSFNLEKTMPKEILSDRSKTVSEVGIKNSLIRVVDL